MKQIVSLTGPVYCTRWDGNWTIRDGLIARPMWAKAGQVITTPAWNKEALTIAYVQEDATKS